MLAYFGGIFKKFCMLPIGIALSVVSNQQEKFQASPTKSGITPTEQNFVRTSELPENNTNQ